jgi:hypothetical protein
MPQTNEAPHRKRRANVPLLGAAGLSFSLAGGVAVAVANTNSATTPAPIAQQVMDEEEIFDVRLTTFRVFDAQSVGTRRPRTRPTKLTAGACGIGLYYPQNPPQASEPTYQTPAPPRPRLTRPARTYKHFR